MLKFKIFNKLDNECKKYWKKLEENSFTDFFQTFDYHKELVTNFSQRISY